MWAISPPVRPPSLLSLLHQRWHQISDDQTEDLTRLPPALFRHANAEAAVVEVHARLGKAFQVRQRCVLGRLGLLPLI